MTRVGEAPPRPWTRTFPHDLTTPDGKADASYAARWEASPFADDYLGRFASELVEAFQLGRHQSTDLLGVSFSSPDIAGHAFGPESREVHDHLRSASTARSACSSTIWSAGSATVAMSWR